MRTLDLLPTPKGRLRRAPRPDSATLALAAALLAATLALPSLAHAELGVLVRNSDGTIVCEELTICTSDAECVEAEAPPRCASFPIADETVSACGYSEQFKDDALCCFGTDCCPGDGTTGCERLEQAGVSGSCRDLTDHDAVLCEFPELRDLCADSLEACYTGDPSGSGSGDVSSWGQGDCDEDEVSNHADCCPCGCDTCLATDCPPDMGGCAIPDAGVDAGEGEPDAGPEEPDAGPDELDAGPEDDPDAGGAEVDAGAGGFDAGKNPDEPADPDTGFAGDGGCECTTATGNPLASAPALLLAALALLLHRRQL